MGRLDHQIKVGGVRVDLVELEACLLGHPRVKEAAARAWKIPLVDAAGQIAAPTSSTGGLESQAGRVVIVAYVVLGSPGGDMGPLVSSSLAPSLIVDLKARVERMLPSVAVPSDLIVLPSLPRNPAGKVIRSQLPPATWMQATGTYPSSPSVQPSSHHPLPSPPSESIVMAAFIRALGRRDIEPTDDFFAAGQIVIHCRWLPWLSCKLLPNLLNADCYPFVL